MITPKATPSSAPSAAESATWCADQDRWIRVTVSPSSTEGPSQMCPFDADAESAYSMFARAQRSDLAIPRG